MFSKLLDKLKNNKKFRTRFIVILAAFLLILIAMIYTLFIRPKKNENKYVYKETKVEHGSLVKGIQESGSVSLENSNISYNLDLEEDDDDDDDDDDNDDDDEETVHYLVVEEVYAANGQRINEGDKLFKLSEDSIAAVRKRLTARQTEAKIELADAESDYNISLISAEGTYNSSMAQAGSAKSVYNATLASLQAQIDLDNSNISLLTNEIILLQEELGDKDLYTTKDEAYSKYLSAKSLYDETDVHNVAAYTANYDSYISAKNSYESACDAIDSRYESINEKMEEVSKLQKDLAEAKESLATKQMEAKQTYDSSVATGETAEDILDYTKTSLESTVKTAQQSLDEINTLLSDFEAFVGTDGIIYADGSGLVTAVNFEANDKLQTTGTMLSYVKEDSYTISIDVLEEDVPSISIGDSVDIELGIYEDQTWKGTIQAISTTASSSGSTVSYPVTIHIEGDTSKLYGGMTADVTFVTDSVEEVNYVSRKAIVYSDSGQSQVYVKNGVKYELKDVEVGFTDGTNIQIVSGLNEGDTVYIASKVSSDESELKNTATKTSDSDVNSENTGDGNSDMPSDFPGGGDMPSSFPGGGSMPSMPSGGFPGGGFPGGN